MENCRLKKHRRRQGEVRNQVLEFLQAGLSVKEICTRLDIHERAVWYHVRQLRNRGYIFPSLAAGQLRQRGTTEKILADWLAVREQARKTEIIKLLRAVLSVAHDRGMISFEKYRHLTPYQQREIKKYDWVTALSPDALKLLKGLLREMERNKDEDARTLVGKLTKREFFTIVEALNVYDMINLEENARLAAEKTAEAGDGVVCP